MRAPAHKAIWRSQTEVPAYYSVAWRDLTLDEHRRFRSRADNLRLVYCDIYEACLLEGPGLEQAPAGIVCWIAKQQLEENPFSGGFKAIAKSLVQARARVENSWFLNAQAVLAATFRYTLEEVESWPPSVFFERVAQAEMLTGVPLNPEDPDKPSKGKSKGPAPRGPGGREKPSFEVEQHSWQGRRRPG